MQTNFTEKQLENKEAKLKEMKQKEIEKKTKIALPTEVKYKVKDYTAPLLSLIFYKIGNLNVYDVKLIELCSASGLNNQVIVAILLAQMRRDIDAIFMNHHIKTPGLLLNILRYKKMSANFKFKQDYGLTDNSQMNMLIEKQRIW